MCRSTALSLIGIILNSESLLQMTDDEKRREELIRLLEQALGIAEELHDGTTEYLIERALDEARARAFRLPEQ